jgi:hypothetical protein
VAPLVFTLIVPLVEPEAIDLTPLLDIVVPEIEMPVPSE